MPLQQYHLKSQKDKWVFRSRATETLTVGADYRPTLWEKPAEQSPVCSLWTPSGWIQGGNRHCWAQEKHLHVLTNLLSCWGILQQVLAVLQQQPLIKLALLTLAFAAQLICSVWLNKQGNTSLRGCQAAQTLYICRPGAGRRHAKC